MSDQKHLQHHHSMTTSWPNGCGPTCWLLDWLKFQSQAKSALLSHSTICPLLHCALSRVGKFPACSYSPSARFAARTLPGLTGSAHPLCLLLSYHSIVEYPCAQTSTHQLEARWGGPGCTPCCRSAAAGCSRSVGQARPPAQTAGRCPPPRWLCHQRPPPPTAGKGKAVDRKWGGTQVARRWCSPKEDPWMQGLQHPIHPPPGHLTGAHIPHLIPSLPCCEARFPSHERCPRMKGHAVTHRGTSGGPHKPHARSTQDALTLEVTHTHACTHLGGNLAVRGQGGLAHHPCGTKIHARATQHP